MNNDKTIYQECVDKGWNPPKEVMLIGDRELTEAEIKKGLSLEVMAADCLGY